MKRFVDKHFFTYSAYTARTSAINVKCPKCSGFGIVTIDEEKAYFKCTECGGSCIKERKVYKYDVHNQCEGCGRYYRVDIIEKDKQHFNVLNVNCPYCSYVMQGKIHKTEKAYSYTGEIKNACEPYFGYELWFLTSYDNKLMWAVNREHLVYLIDYLSADLREKPVGYKAMKTQSHSLPTFMKVAKNRKGIVKKLEKLLEG